MALPENENLSILLGEYSIAGQKLSLCLLLPLGKTERRQIICEHALSCLTAVYSIHLYYKLVQRIDTMETRKS